MVCFEALKRKGEVWAKTSSLTFLLSKSFLKPPPRFLLDKRDIKMAKLRVLLGSKGRFCGVLGLPPQKEMPIKFLVPFWFQLARILATLHDLRHLTSRQNHAPLRRHPAPYAGPQPDC